MARTALALFGQVYGTHRPETGNRLQLSRVHQVGMMAVGSLPWRSLGLNLQGECGKTVATWHLMRQSLIPIRPIVGTNGTSSCLGNIPTGTHLLEEHVEENLSSPEVCRFRRRERIQVRVKPCHPCPGGKENLAQSNYGLLPKNHSQEVARETRLGGA